MNIRYCYISVCSSITESIAKPKFKPNNKDNLFPKTVKIEETTSVQGHQDNSNNNIDTSFANSDRNVFKTDGYGGKM